MIKMKVIGLMSGTSLDGLDLAFCEFVFHNHQWEYKLLETQEIPYEDSFKKQLKEAILLPEKELELLNEIYGSWLGEQVAAFIEERHLKVDAIASHGHTIHHRPEEGVTYQLGSGKKIVEKTGITVVNDFRTLDVQLGGQGAPLVPVGDALLFSKYDFCINLGGISNVSFDQGGVRKAFDIGVANMLLNYGSEKLGKPYDKGGEIAQSGHLNVDLLYRLNQLPFYQQEGPKSLGFEWFQSEVVPLLEKVQMPIADLLCTATHHVVNQLVRSVKAQNKTHASVLVTGGGAYNDFLIALLQEQLGDNYQVIVPESSLVSFKEALIFAFMGVLKLHHIPNALSSVTGASRDSCTGVVYIPKRKGKL